MSDLIDDPYEGMNSPEFSVSELSGAIKRMIEGEFSHVRIKGEIGRVSLPRSGHVYLDLKDDKSVISGVIWKGVAARLPMRPEEGLEVVATGRITTFPGQSKYQIVIDDMKPAGVGALMAMLEKRKALLQSEGLFDPARKKPLPYLPEVIGVVTSPSGAVIRDILHRLRDRFPRKVLIWPVAVQGERCAPEVVRGIEGFNALTPGGAMPRPDLIIVARGGGSIEDLWGFNEEAVARAAAASDIPLISAVGHETDTTLIDFVSDVRAPTPTAAAELAVPVRHELLAWVNEQDARMSRALSGALMTKGQRLRDLSRALPRPQSLVETPRQRLDMVSDRLPVGLSKQVQTKRIALSDASGLLRPTVLRRMVDAERRSVTALSDRLAPALIRNTRAKRDLFDARVTRLRPTQLVLQVQDMEEKLSRTVKNFVNVSHSSVVKWKEKITALDRLRETLGYKETLRRGYAVVRSDGDLVTQTKDVKGEVEIEFADGRIVVGKDTQGSKPLPKKAKPKPPEQGSLF